MGQSKIEWTDKTWNPITGCTPISAGCAHCFAKRMSKRLAGRHGYPEAPRNFDVTWHEDKLYKPIRWRKPRRIFPCSMSDMFHKDVPRGWITSVFHVMVNLAPHHTYQILTKRPRRMLEYLLITRWLDRGKLEEKVKNIWFGVTAENQPMVDERIPELLLLKKHYPWLTLFVSIEPMLEAIDLRVGLGFDYVTQFGRCDVPSLDLVIVGAETGPGARPMDLNWARSVRDQCQAAGVAFFFKRDSDGNRELDGCLWEEFPG